MSIRSRYASVSGRNSCKCPTVNIAVVRTTLCNIHLQKDYFSNLCSPYTSRRMIDEFVAVLSDCVERELLSKVGASPP